MVTAMRPQPTATGTARALLANAQAQADAARRGDWHAVARLADERDGLLDALSAALSAYPADHPERTDLAGVLAQVLAFDREVTGHAEAETKRLATELAQTRQGQTVAAAYARPAQAAQTDLVNVAG